MKEFLGSNLGHDTPSSAFVLVRVIGFHMSGIITNPDGQCTDCQCTDWYTPLDLDK